MGNDFTLFTAVSNLIVPDLSNNLKFTVGGPIRSVVNLGRCLCALVPVGVHACMCRCAQSCMREYFAHAVRRQTIWISYVPFRKY